MSPNTYTAGAVTLLVVEDDLEVQDLLKDEFTDEGYRILQAFDGGEAQRLIREESYHVVIMDLNFPKGNGMDLMTEVIKRDGNIPVIVLSARRDPETRREAFVKGAERFVVKPFRTGTLKEMVRLSVLKQRGV